MAGKDIPFVDHDEKERAAASNENAAPCDSDDDTPSYAPEDARYRAPGGRVAPCPFSEEELAPDTGSPPDGRVAPHPVSNEEPATDAESPPDCDPPAGSGAPQDLPLPLAAGERDPLDIPPRPSRAPDAEEPQYHRLPLSVGEEEALRARGIEPPPYRPVRVYDDTDEAQYHRLPLTVAEEEALKARLAGKPLPPVEKKREWRPDTPLYVRFDVGGGFDVSNQRDRHDRTDWSDYDPLKT